MYLKLPRQSGKLFSSYFNLSLPTATGFDFPMHFYEPRLPDVNTYAAPAQP